MKRIVIDAGHTMGDNPYVSSVGNEGQVMYDVAKKLERVLVDKYKDIQIILTRELLLENPTLTKRGQYAKNADMFLSLHSNAGGGTGTEVFYSVDLPQNREYARALSSDISKALGLYDRGAKVKESQKYKGEDFFTVIDTAQDIGCKHVYLIEFFFHDNKKDIDAFINNYKKMEIELVNWIGNTLKLTKKDIDMNNNCKCSNDNVIVYKNVKEFPQWAKFLVDDGIIKGNDNGDTEITEKELQNYVIIQRMIDLYSE